MTHISLSDNSSTDPAFLSQWYGQKQAWSPLIHPLLCILICKSRLWSIQQCFVSRVDKCLLTQHVVLLKTWSEARQHMSGDHSEDCFNPQNGRGREERDSEREMKRLFCDHGLNSKGLSLPPAHTRFHLFIVCSYLSFQTSALIGFWRELTKFLTC